jgi:cytoskeletal protein CcmA (bactofilin family)
MDTNDNKGCLNVGEGVSISGTIRLPGTIKVNGSIDGTIEAKEIYVGVSGRVTGQVTVDVADIHGEVRESIEVRERATIRSTGRMEGNLTYRSIAIEHGGVVEGKITLIGQSGDHGKAAPAATPSIPLLSPVFPSQT